MNGSRGVELWRHTEPSCQAGDRFRSEWVFPSGRQALSQALLLAGLGRASRVACPEWSSHCLLSAVARYATPIPMNAATRFGVPVEALLVYEQWGWPSAQEAWRQVEECFPEAPVIWDRVDSADSLVRASLPSKQIAADLCSLSKLLGLAGGGLLRTPVKFVEFQAEEPSAMTRELLQAPGELRDTFEYKEYFRNQRQVVNPGVIEWLETNSLSSALSEELRRRRRNVELVLQSELAESWDPWMRDAVQQGAGPGIAPLLRGAARNKLEAAAGLLRDRYDVTTTLYHFNWSGNPTAPQYELCLPLPVHGLVTELEEILRGLEALQ